MKSLILFLILIFAINNTRIWAQDLGLNRQKTDSIFSMHGKFRRSGIKTGRDTIIDFREIKRSRKKISEIRRTIEKAYLRLATQRFHQQRGRNPETQKFTWW